MPNRQSSIVKRGIPEKIQETVGPRDVAEGEVLVVFDSEALEHEHGVSGELSTRGRGDAPAYNVRKPEIRN